MKSNPKICGPYHLLDIVRFWPKLGNDDRDLRVGGIHYGTWVVNQRRRHTGGSQSTSQKRLSYN